MNWKRFFLLLVPFFLAGCIDTDVLVGDVSYYVDKARCNLRVGILSDTHLSPPHSDAAFLKALNYFAEREVDAVVIAGDVTNDGSLAARRGVMKVWNKAFSGGRRLDGSPVALIAVTGANDNEKVFEELSGEAFAPAFLREVKGYSFIGANWKDVAGVDAWALKPLLAKMDKAKPFFYIQSLVPYATCCPNEEWPNVFDGGKVSYMLSKFPNAVAICGRSHTSLTDESAFWRGDFTCVNAGSFSYVKPRGPDWIVPSEQAQRAHPFAKSRGSGKKAKVNHGLVMSVYDSDIVFERIDFGAEPEKGSKQGVYVEKVGPDWKVALPAKAGPRPEMAVPQFWDDTRLMVFPSEQMVAVQFPPVLAKHTGVRAYAYEVRCSGDGGETIVKRLYSPVYSQGEMHETKPIVCEFPRAELPRGLVRFTVTPLDAFGRTGKPVSGEANL